MSVFCAAALSLVLAVTPASAQSSGAPEGIKVHGDWTLTIRNPDGSLAAVHEFKNALAFDGASILARLLGGAAVAGPWIIYLGTSTNVCPTINCTIGEPAVGGTSADLTRSVPSTGPDAGKLVLRGSIRIPASTSIQSVTTALESCGPAVPAASCRAPLNDTLTQRSLGAAAVPVIADQLVEVKVVISFS
jgi:hypothetical protein